MEAKPLHKTKTFWAAVTGLVTAFGMLCTGDMALAEFIPTAATCLVGIFLRQGLPK